jgi:quercetin dioxygenase-like cupin family protein
VSRVFYNIDCNRHEYGIFDNHIIKIASPSDLHPLKGGRFIMKIIDYRKVPPTVPFSGVTKWVPIGPDDGAPNFIMRVFEIEPGHTSPNHTHFWEHEVFILAGNGGVRDQDGVETPIGEGTAVFIPGGENHCLINRGEDVFRFICLIPTGVE